MRSARTLVCLALVAAAIACRGPQSQESAVPTTPAASSSSTSPGDTSSATQQLQTQAARFAPVELKVDLTGLPENERQALARLVSAAKVFDALFLRQVWAGNESLLLELTRDTSPLGQARLHYFLITTGPWSRLDENQAFIPGAPEKPPAANFYPAGATKEDVDAWLKTLSPPERTRASGFFTTIRRGPDGRFIAVP